MPQAPSPTATSKPKAAKVWARQAEDWYVEPVWCNERLFDVEKFEGNVYDPSCGLGRIVDAARKAGYNATGSDIIRRSPRVMFLNDFIEDEVMPADNIVSNPPFKYCNKAPYQYVRKALEASARKTALLLPLNWMTGQKRSEFLEETPLYRIYVLAPRPSMPPGEHVVSGQHPGNGTRDFAWFVFLRGFEGEVQLRWLRR